MFVGPWWSRVWCVAVVRCAQGPGLLSRGHDHRGRGGAGEGCLPGQCHGSGGGGRTEVQGAQRATLTAGRQAGRQSTQGEGPERGGRGDNDRRAVTDVKGRPRRERQARPMMVSPSAGGVRPPGPCRTPAAAMVTFSFAWPCQHCTVDDLLLSLMVGAPTVPVKRAGAAAACLTPSPAPPPPDRQVRVAAWPWA